jgi:hypothetical protein
MSIDRPIYRELYVFGLVHITIALAKQDPYSPGLWVLLEEIRIFSLTAYDFVCDYIATHIIGG